VGCRRDTLPRIKIVVCDDKAGADEIDDTAISKQY